jgi:hypothetical protein
MNIASCRGNVIQLPNPSLDKNIIRITLRLMVARKSRLPNPCDKNKGVDDD